MHTTTCSTQQKSHSPTKPFANMSKSVKLKYSQFNFEQNQKIISQSKYSQVRTHTIVILRNRRKPSHFVYYVLWKEPQLETKYTMRSSKSLMHVWYFFRIRPNACGFTPPELFCFFFKYTRVEYVEYIHFVEAIRSTNRYISRIRKRVDTTCSMCILYICTCIELLCAR